MTTFAYQSIGSYGGAGPLVPQIITANQSGTLDDGDAPDDRFQVGDTIYTDGVGQEFTYEGFIANGTIIVAVNKSNPDQRVLFSASSTAETSYPNPLDLADIDPSPICFAAGTLIATPEGTAAVEDLQVGDTIRTADGGTTRVKWVGRQTVHRKFTPRERFEPVRVGAGALGAGLPLRDLVLTADHALFIDGLLVNAGALVNGTSIVRVPAATLPETVTYYHVETDAHEVILAEGTPAETFIDNVGRRAFDNFAEFEALYGPERTMIAEMAAPRVMSSRQLPERLRAYLAGNAVA